MKTKATAYGAAALELLAKQIMILKGRDPLSPVTVVVPSNHIAVATRRNLAARPGGVSNVNFTTLRTLAEALGTARLADAGYRPVSSAILTAAIRAALHKEPGVFEPVATHPATEQALTAAYRELRQVPEAAADAVAECSLRAFDIVRLCRDAHQRVAANWYDEVDLLVAATEELQRASHHELAPVVFHLLPELTTAQAGFLSALASRGPIRINVGLTGNTDADAPVLATYARAGMTLPALKEIDRPCATRIISASDPDDEVRAAVRLILEWAQDGIRLGRSAVLYGNAEPYARLIQSHLGSAGIAFTGMPVRSVGDMLLGRTLRALLALPDRAFRRPDVLAILADSPILDNGQPVPSRVWERLSREAGVVGGEDWSRRLTALAASKRNRAEAEDTRGNSSRAEHFRRDADRADALGTFVERLRADMALGAEVQTWTGLVRWTTDLLESYLGDEQLREAWPDDEQDAATQVVEAISQLAELDAIGGPAPGLTVFHQVLDSELRAPARQIGHLGAGVFVGHVSTARGMLFDRTVILGMAEGRFPPRRLEDSLLPDSERAAAGGHLKLRMDRVHDDHHDFLAAVAGPQETVLTWPRGDLRKSNNEPASRWLLEDAARLSGIPGIRSDDLLKLRGEPWFDNIASFADGVARTPVFTGEQELRVAAIARGERRNPALTGDSVLVRAREVIDLRASSDFTRFDGNLTAATTDIVGLQRVSATQLQTWAACPRAYLFKYLLGVEHIEEPERQLSIDALDRGTLFHAILEQFVRDAIEGGHPLTGWSNADRERLHQIARIHFERFQRDGRTGRELLWRRDRSGILTELDRTLDLDNARLARGLRPVAAEHGFDLVEVSFPDGRALHLRGSIDRIDRNRDGSLEILDYKTGKHSSYKALTEQTPHDGGKRLQLYVYALAGRQLFPDAPTVTAFYWFTKTDQLIGYPITEHVEQEVSSAIHTIVDGIESGVFPAHPTGKAFGWVDCWYCTPDGLGTADVEREWKQQREDPALAAYVQLADPEAVS